MKSIVRKIMLASVLAGARAVPLPALAQDAEDLAKKLSNPIAELISVPLQLNYDQHLRYWADSPDGGPHDLGFRFVVTFLFPK